MHIMHMLGIVSLVFILALFFMCLFRERLKNPIINPLLVSACAFFLFCWTYSMYEHRGGKMNGFMTFDNISPYISTVIPLTVFMNRRVKDFAYSAIAFLAFGMFVAMFISPEVEYLSNFHQDAQFLHVSEALCHLIMGVYGFYLILADKVTLTLKSFAKALAFIYASIGFGIFLNYFFHQSNFGMNMYGDYSIYFMDIFDSFEATLIAYLVGVLFTLAVGFLIALFVDRISRTKKHAKGGEEAEKSIATTSSAEDTSK